MHPAGLLGVALGAAIGAWLVASGRQGLLGCILSVLFAAVGALWLYQFLSGEGSWAKLVASIPLLYFYLPRAVGLAGSDRCRPRGRSGRAKGGATLGAVCMPTDGVIPGYLLGRGPGPSHGAI
ncbi:hypothetical protein PABY_00910 [Pyrodictium abyssi]|uniref:Uncharacterized protein n=1 Tax=Pyrodictium abyssi TaxID=54256 RepID=A0ABN6ZJV2_9CREN|nr:hypothetical protein PABY_00910 [Pyrodictium abyssi]